MSKCPGKQAKIAFWRWPTAIKYHSQMANLTENENSNDLNNGCSSTRKAKSVKGSARISELANLNWDWVKTYLSCLRVWESEHFCENGFYLYRRLTVIGVSWKHNQSNHHSDSNDSRYQLLTEHHRSGHCANVTNNIQVEFFFSSGVWKSFHAKYNNLTDIYKIRCKSVLFPRKRSSQNVCKRFRTKNCSFFEFRRHFQLIFQAVSFIDLFHLKIV